MNNKSSNLGYWVYDPMGRLVARCYYAEDAAAIIATHGICTKVKVKLNGQFKLVYVEDARNLAGDSYDEVAEEIRTKEAQL